MAQVCIVCATIFLCCNCYFGFADLLKEKHQVIGTVVLFSGCWLIASTVYEHFKVQKIERGELGEEARLDLEKKREYAAQKPDPKTLNLKLDLHDLNLYKSLRHLSFDEKDEKVEKQESQAHWASISFVDQIVPRKERERDIKSYELRKVDAEMRARANANQNNSDKTK